MSRYHGAGLNLVHGWENIKDSKLIFLIGFKYLKNVTWHPTLTKKRLMGGFWGDVRHERPALIDGLLDESHRHIPDHRRAFW